MIVTQQAFSLRIHAWESWYLQPSCQVKTLQWLNIAADGVTASLATALFDVGSTV